MADVTPIIPLPPTPSEVQDAVQRMKMYLFIAHDASHLHDAIKLSLAIYLLIAALRRMSETISSASRSSLHVSSLLRDKPHSLPPRFSSSMDSVNSSVKRCGIQSHQILN
jgi:hypothetical protein